MIEINFSVDTESGVILYNGDVYRKETVCEEYWGRYETADYLGFRTRVKTSNGFKESVNTTNLYNGDSWRQFFPDFGKALDMGVLRPYPSDVMRSWLALPRSERKRRLEENIPYWIYKEQN